MPRSSETCFLIHSRSLTRFSASAEPEILSARLAHCITRNPGDLISHVRRIFLCLKLDDGERLFGALTDLFITLNGKGGALRSRLLGMLQNHLTDAQYSALQGGHVESMEFVEPLPWPRFSRLYQPRLKEQELVAQLTGEESESHTGILAQARDLIDCGQIEAARHMMEEALLADEATTALHEELLNLYRHTRDYEAFLTMWTQLEHLSPQLQDMWKEVNDYLDTHHSGTRCHV